jgi:hypothetical protein
MNDSRNKQLAKKVLGKLKDLTNKSKKINSLICKLQTARGINAGIFGGACRDWYLDKEPKDIDIIVECEELNSTILDDLILGADTVEKNKFDGFKIFYDGISFDIWKLHEARQFKELNLEPSFENLMKTVPLSTDQIVVTLKGDVYEDGFWKTLDTQTIDVVNLKQEDLEYISRRAQRFSTKYGWKLSEKANEFVNNQKLSNHKLQSDIDSSNIFEAIKDYGPIKQTHSSGNKNIGIVTNKIENYFCSEPEFIGDYYNRVSEFKIQDPIFLLNNSNELSKKDCENIYNEAKKMFDAKVYIDNKLIGYCKLNKPEISIIKQRENKDNIEFKLNKDFIINLK